MTVIKSDNLALAGLDNDKDMLLFVGRILLADLFWDDESESVYRSHCNESGKKWIQEIMDRPETPQIPEEIETLIKMAGICGRIEQAWGESFFSLARRITPKDQIQRDVHKDLMYYTLMACIGHGIGPRDMIEAKFPEDMDPSPIHIENPMENQLQLLGSIDMLI